MSLSEQHSHTNKHTHTHAHTHTHTHIQTHMCTHTHTHTYTHTHTHARTHKYTGTHARTHTTSSSNAYCVIPTVQIRKEIGKDKTNITVVKKGLATSTLPSVQFTGWGEIFHTLAARLTSPTLLTRQTGKQTDFYYQLEQSLLVHVLTEHRTI